MIKYLGTHNSGTFSKLVGWQRPFGFILNATSQCQTLNIEEQIARNVRFFNLQITRYKNEWVFSHGVCIYTEKFSDALEVMKKNATTASPIYFQLILDNNFILGQDKEEFKKLTHNLLEELDVTNVVMLFAYIENNNSNNEYVYKSQIQLNQSEHYWSASWAKFNAKSWLDKLPLPKRHAKQHNQNYIDSNTADYLMLDFIEHGTYPITEKDLTININGNKIKLKNGKIGYMELSYKAGTVADPIVITYDYTIEPKSIFVTSKPNIIKSSLSTFYKTIEITPIAPGTSVLYISAAYNDEIVESSLTIKVKPIMNHTDTTTAPPIFEPTNYPTMPPVSEKPVPDSSKNEPVIIPVVTDFPTSYPTQDFSYSFNIASKGKLTNNNSIPVIANIEVVGDELTSIKTSCASKYAYVESINPKVAGKNLYSGVIGYIHPLNVATANYRFTVNSIAHTKGGQTFKTSTQVIIYGKQVNPVTEFPTDYPTIPVSEEPIYPTPSEPITPVITDYPTMGVTYFPEPVK